MPLMPTAYGQQARPQGQASIMALMGFSYPRSFLRLLAAGFTLIALPLVVALVTNAVAIDQLANRSQEAVYRAVQATQSSRRVLDSVTAMERSARQLVILGDRELFDNYVLNRRQFAINTSRLAALPIDEEQRAVLKLLMLGEAGIFSILSDPKAEQQELAKAVERFGRWPSTRERSWCAATR